MIGNKAKIALENYVATFNLFLIAGICDVCFNLTLFQAFSMVLPCVVLVVVTLICIYSGDDFQVAVRSSFLGFLLAIGIYTIQVAPPNLKVFGTYMSVMSFFHFSEYAAIALVHPGEVSVDSFVLNHSPEYIAAAVTSWTEFFIESYFFPGLKQIYWLSNIGLVICILGEVLRKTSMITAGRNFNHYVQSEKIPDHVLVTHGVYSWFRHPSYVGWFYWSIGTQIIVLNPICIPLYGIVSWLFFQSRIYIEEISLLNFFGQTYCDYQQKVGTGLPFIKGYRIYKATGN